MRAERDELTVAEKVLAWFDEPAAPEAVGSTPPGAQVAGRTVLLIPCRVADMALTALPADYQRLVALARTAGEPVATR